MFLDIKDANLCSEVRPLAEPYACLQWLHPSYCTHTLKYDLNYSEQHRFRHRSERDRKSAERQALEAYSIISMCVSFKRSIYCARAGTLGKGAGKDEEIASLLFSLRMSPVHMAKPVAIAASSSERL